MNGRKDDKGKLPWHLLPMDAVEEILKVLQFGAAKYAPRNWELGMDWDRPYNALLRHVSAYYQGNDLDPETQLPTLAHAGACLLFLLAYQVRNVGHDTRPSKDLSWQLPNQEVRPPVLQDHSFQLPKQKRTPSTKVLSPTSAVTMLQQPKSSPPKTKNVKKPKKLSVKPD